MKRLNIFCLLFSLLFLSSCQRLKSWVAREFMADKVSDGVARLSAQHLSMIVSELNPKFDESEPTIVPSTDPAQYGKGTVTWKLSDVDIDHPNETAVHTDCNGEQGLWQGRVSVLKASKSMYGRLTGNPTKPVIPEPGTLKVKVHANAHNLSIRFPSKDGSLRISNGEIKFVAWPRLAQNDTGMRLAPTPNTRFEDVKLSGVSGVLTSQNVDVPVVVSDSNLHFQVGAGEQGEENVVRGKLTLGGHSREVPRDGQGLDPNYDAQQFVNSYACKIPTPSAQGASGTQGTISYQHVPIENKVAPGLAALTSALMAALATELDEDSECGMNSPQVLRESVLSGNPGGAGTLKSTLKRPCVLEFSHFQTPPNCFGQAKVIHGIVKVLKAQKTISGVVVATQDDYKQAVQEYGAELMKSAEEASKKRPKAVLPSSTRPVNVTLSVKLDEVSMKDICTSHGNTRHPRHCQNLKANANEQVGFSIASGEVSAEISPVAGQNLDKESPAHQFCSIKTPMGEAAITVKDIQAGIEKGGMTLKVHAAGQFSLVRGFIGERENELRGSLTIGDKNYALKTDSENFVSLDPSYERSVFLDSFLSCQKLALASSEEQCRPEAGLSANMARLLVLNAGSLLKVAASSVVPQSFASKYALDSAQTSEEDTLLHMSASLPEAIDLSEREFKPLTKFIDALENKTRLRGQVLSLNGTMVRHGYRLNKPTTVMGVNINPLSWGWVEGLSAKIQDKKEVIIRPIAADSTSIELSATVSNFVTNRYKPQAKRAEPSILIESGLFDIKATPFFGMDTRTAEDEQPSYSISTPVVRFDEIIIADAPIIFTGSNMTFPLYVHHAKLRAHNGRYKGQGNYIQGEMSFRLTSDLSQIPSVKSPAIAIAEQALVPNIPEPYDQEAFDAAYANTEYLHEVLAAE